MLLTFYKGHVINMFESHHPSFSLLIGSAQATHKDWLNVSIFLIVATFAWAFFFILQVITMRTYTSQLSLTALVCFIGTLQSILVTLVMERRPGAWAIEFDLDLLSAAYYGIVGSGIAYYVQGPVMHTRGPVLVTVFNPLMMIMVAIMGSLILAEKIYLGGVIGAVLIVIELYAVLWGKNKDGNTATTENLEENNVQLQSIV